jgi:hypothetical protein
MRMKLTNFYVISKSPPPENTKEKLELLKLHVEIDKLLEDRDASTWLKRTYMLNYFGRLALILTIALVTLAHLGANI